RQPPRDVALQRELLARLRRARVAADGAARGPAGRGGPGADAGADRRQLLPHLAALGLLHLQGPGRDPGRAVQAAPRRGGAMSLAIFAAQADRVSLTS